MLIKNSSTPLTPSQTHLIDNSSPKTLISISHEKINVQNTTSPDYLKNSGIKRSSTNDIKSSNSKLKVAKVTQQNLSLLSTHPSYKENLTREQAEKELKPLAVGTWLIRYSANQNQYVISQKVSSHEFKHSFIQQASFEHLEARLGYFSQIRLFKTIQLYLKASQSVEAEKSAQISPSHADLLKAHSLNHGLLSAEQVQKILKDKQEKSWILHASPDSRYLVVSYKTTEGTIETFPTLNQQHDWSIQDIYAIFGKMQAIPKYDYQLQLNLGKGVTASLLETKSHLHQIETETIHLNQKLEESMPPLEKISKLTHHSRLYLIGHSHPGASNITTEEKPDLIYDYTLTISHFVHLLKTYAPHLQKPDDGQCIKISLVICYAGLESVRGKNSFALQLSQALDKAGIPAEILARTARVYGDLDHLRKEVEDRHHSNGDKISVVTTKGHSTIRMVQYEDRSPT